MNLPKRMLRAAEVLEEASALYGYTNPAYAPWTAVDLRRESEHVQADTPFLYDVNCGGHVYNGEDV